VERTRLVKMMRVYVDGIYRPVNPIELRGTFELADCMSAECRAGLARWCNEVEAKAGAEKARRRHAGLERIAK
jgi:hypothetical protein